MGSVFRYSGLTTKVRAMRGRLLTKEEYKIMSNMSSVAEVINMLKERKSYMDIFEGKDPEYIHRGELEKLMLCSKYIDFEKLYAYQVSFNRSGLNKFSSRHLLSSGSYAPQFGQNICNSFLSDVIPRLSIHVCHYTIVIPPTHRSRG